MAVFCRFQRQAVIFGCQACFFFATLNFGLASPARGFQKGRSGGANLPPDATARTIFRIGAAGGYPCVGRGLRQTGPVSRGRSEEGGRFVSVKPAGGNSSVWAMERGALQSAWESIRAGLRRDCGARTFDGWLRPIALGNLDSETGTLRLELPSQFMADWVQTHFSERLTLPGRPAVPAVRHIVIRVGAAAPRT